MTVTVYCFMLLVLRSLGSSQGCNFYPVGEYLRFVRIPENLPVGGEVLKIEVYPRKNLNLQPVDKTSDVNYFSYRDVNRTHVSVTLTQSLEDLVDSDNPQNVLKFRLGCDFDEGDDMISAYLSVTVYVEDINDHAPVFVDIPYEVTVDELTPIGLTIFKSIYAFDRDKPNTPNSDVQYSIVSGNEKGFFALERSSKASLILKKPLDYDDGDKEYYLTILATDRGGTPKSTNTTVHVIVVDNDDLGPKFTEPVYRTQIAEFYPITGKRIHKELIFKEPIHAYDQDLGIGVPVRYDLISGNERHIFSLDAFNGTLFLNKEIDLDSENSLSANTFSLQIQAVQVDNPLKTDQARVEVEVLDLNDNLPEFEVDFYNISIVENLPNGFSVLQVMASDKDQGDNGEFTFKLQDPNKAFSIDPRTGWLTVRDQSKLDREKHANLKMKVYAKEKNPSVVGTRIKETSRTTKWRRHQSAPKHRNKTLYIFPDQTSMNSDNIEFVEESNELMSFVTVEVTLLDANDNNPVFLPSNLYEFAVKSNAKIGTFIGKVKAIDPDLGRNGMVLYDIQRTSNLTVTSPFQVDAQTGSITLAESPLIEGRHALFIEASDQPTNPSERRFTLAVVSIDVIKPTKGQKPDNPGFIGAPYEFWVGSNVGIGTSVGQIRVNEAMDKNQVLYDLLHSYPEGVPFAVEERSGTITVVDKLSKYNRPIYEFEAVAQQDNINVTLISNATLHVVDVNDERGILFRGAHSPITFHVKENAASAIIGRIIDSSISLNKSNNVMFFIANQQDVSEDIAISSDGTIYAQKPLDREKRSVYRLTVIGEYSKGPVSGAGIYQVTINIDDENDNAPTFEHFIYEGTIKENSPTGTEVTLNHVIHAKDMDAGVNSVFTMTLAGEGKELFEVNQAKGKVKFVGRKLDREEKSHYNLKLIARDKGNLSSESKLVISILDENDNAPQIKQIVIPAGINMGLLESVENSIIKILREKKNEFSGQITHTEMKPKSKFPNISENHGPLFSLPENVLTGSSILKIDAFDDDSGVNGELQFQLFSESYIPVQPAAIQNFVNQRFFIVNEQHGYLTVARTLPPEVEFRLVVLVSDTHGKSDNISLRIYVTDVNDHPPIFKKSWYNFDVEEASYSRRVLGKIEAVDDDFGQNSNITYYIYPKKPDVPFEISPLNGVFSVNGDLDREKQDLYIIQVVAKDNGDVQLSSSVSVEIQILDVNDNPPKFYGYDELLQWKHPEAHEYSNHHFESVTMIPVYHASLDENSPIGTTVTQVYANDSDFTENGNGLLLYNIPQRKNHVNLFTIDSKAGVITTVGKLDYESQTLHNVTIIASDLGSPSLSSTALLLLSVKDIPEEEENLDKPVFITRYYELEIEENSHTPIELLTLNITDYYENLQMKYSIINGDGETKKMFLIDPKNGTLYLIRSPDREVKDVHEIIIRAEKQKNGRNLPHMIYPVSDDVLEGMSKYEVKVVVRIKDVNDNSPKFKIQGRPFVTAIPTTATFGFQVIRLKATDADIGLNSDIRYQIINDQSQRFAIDPLSGQVRAVASFIRDAGRIFGFDVKATDKKGADDGRSAIANVFVYVLDENKQLVMVLGIKPAQVENDINNITEALSGMTGYDVRIRQLESHSRSIDDAATNIYVYAVDPMSNAIIDMDVLERTLLKREAELRQELAAYRILEVGDKTISQPRHVKMLSSVEISIVALGCLVFVGAFITALCILCVKKKKRRNKPFSQHRINTMGYSTEHLTKLGALFPSGGTQCKELNQSYSEVDSYVDILNAHKKNCPHTNTIEEFGKAHQKCVKSQYGSDFQASELFNQKHEKNCIKYNNQRPINKKRRSGKNETSINSVHSSGHDSGIAEGRCGCGQSPTHTSEGSSGGSYEDSLKSDPKKPFHFHQFETEFEPKRFTRRASIGPDPIDLRRCVSGRQSFTGLNQRAYYDFKPAKLNKRQLSNPNISSVQPHINSYLQPMRRSSRKVEPYQPEPMVDYDQSDIDDINKETNRNVRRSNNFNKSKLLELTGQTAVFVATPAAAAIMRRQGSDRLVLRR